MSIAASQRGVHALVEKPMALTVADARAMIEAANVAHRRVFVVKQNRYNAPIRLVSDAIRAGVLGKLYMVQCNVLWNRPQEYYSGSNWRGRKALEGGALYTQVSHFIDLLLWWFGDLAFAETRLETKCHDIEIEDCGSATLRFSSGVLGSLVWTTCVYNKNYEGSITIIGEHGTIKIGGGYLNRIEFWDVRSYPLPEGVVFEDKPNEYGRYQGTSSNHDRVVADVVATLLRERRDVVEGDEGLKTVDAIERIYAGARRG